MKLPRLVSIGLISLSLWPTYAEAGRIGDLCARILKRKVSMTHSSRNIQKLADIKTLLIVVAMDVEFEAILKHAQKRNFKKHVLHSKLGIEIFEIKMKDHTVLIGKSGVGPVNAALLTTLADQRFSVDGIILLGVGGALDEKLHPGQLVIAKQVIQHDSIFSSEHDPTLMSPGDLFLSLSPEQRRSPLMKSSDVLSSFLDVVARQRNITTFHGTILSGNEFAGSLPRKQKLKSLEVDALLVDMEAAGISQVARNLNIPMAVAKTVADRANPVLGMENDYKVFLKSASEFAAEVFGATLEHFEGKSE